MSVSIVNMFVPSSFNSITVHCIYFGPGSVNKFLCSLSIVTLFLHVLLVNFDLSYIHLDFCAICPTYVMYSVSDII